MTFKFFWFCQECNLLKNKPTFIFDNISFFLNMTTQIIFDNQSAQKRQCLQKIFYWRECQTRLLYLKRHVMIVCHIKNDKLILSMI